ncbi:stage 0 sporulation protein [Coprobacillus sp. BIOML-A1]|nr:stage 0 sporulation protein [Coprobacillus sp. BIOML-A1]
MEEIKLASVKFKSAGKIYYFSTNLKLKKDDRVVVETARGLELGEISQELKDISEFNLDTELKKIVRKATKKDIENYQKNVKDAKQALVTCKEIVSRYDVNMQLTNCEYTLDKAKVIFMYTSDDRVDFRELLKELAVVFKCRIELRQIGPRDKAKVIGGIGTCGLPLCCSTLLGEFNGVSINMAKNQMLAINIEKISGACGRLMCCLKYEDEIYSLEKERFPKIGSRVKYQDKDVKVTGLNVINDLVKIETNNGILFVGLDEIKFDKNNHAGKKNGKPRSH